MSLINEVKIKINSNNISHYISPDGNISYIDDYILGLIEDHMYDELFDDSNVNELKYASLLSNLSPKSLLSFLSKLHENNIQFSYNKLMQELFFCTYRWLPSDFDEIFDYLHKIGNFDSYKFIYNCNVTVRALDIIKLDIQIDYDRLISKSLKHGRGDLNYLLDQVDNTSNINISDIISTSFKNMELINKFIDKGTNIEIIDCKHSNISTFFECMHIQNICLIKRMIVTKYSYAKFILTTPTEKLDALLSNGCEIIFDGDNTCEDTEDIAIINQERADFDKKLDIFEKHNIDPYFILRNVYYLLSR
jgi:hypothetical protein